MDIFNNQVLQSLKISNFVRIAEFADPPTKAVADVSPSIPIITDEPEDIVPANAPPATLMQWGVLILNTANPKLKVCRYRGTLIFDYMFSAGGAYPSCSPPFPNRTVSIYWAPVIEPS
jgi:hypothetical protein